MRKKSEILLCVLALLFSFAAASLAWGFMGAATDVFWIRFVCGFCFTAVPILVVLLSLQLMKKR